MIKLIIVAVLFVFAVLAGLCGLFVLSIYARVKGSPRAQMFHCERGHGFIFEKDCIFFMGQAYCPYCFGVNMQKSQVMGEIESLRNPQRALIDKSKLQ